MRKQMKTMEEKNASYMQQTIDLQEVSLLIHAFLFEFDATDRICDHGLIKCICNCASVLCRISEKQIV